MVMNAWPSSVNQAPARNFTKAISCGLSSGEDELSQRRTRTYPECEASFTFPQCTLAQFHAIRGFYNDTLNQVLPFTAPWLEAAGFYHHFCTFSSAPKASLSGFNLDVSINVIVFSGVPVDGNGTVIYGEVD